MSEVNPNLHIFPNMKDLAERRNQFADPDFIILVGHDTTDRDEHPLYEKRVHLPVDESMKANIAEDGVKQEVIVQRITAEGGGFYLACVAGRQRIKAARAANVELRARGMQPIMMPIRIESGEAPKLAGIMVSENELRTQNGPLDRARLMKKLQDLGVAKPEIMRRFGATDVTLANWSKMLALHPDVHTIIDAGECSANAALGVATVAFEKQADALRKIIDAGQGKTSGTKVRAGAGTGPQFHPPKPKVLQALVANPAAQTNLMPAVFQALRWAATGEGLDQLETVKALLPPPPEKKAKAPAKVKAKAAPKKPAKDAAKKGGKGAKPAPAAGTPAKRSSKKKGTPAEAPAIIPAVFVPPVVSIVPAVFVPPVT